MWSGWKRWDFELMNYVPLSEDRLENIANSWRRPPARVREDLLKLDFTPWKKSLRYIYMFQELMEQNNIPYMHVQGIRTNWVMPSERMLYTEIGKDFMKNIYLDKINEKIGKDIPRLNDTSNIQVELLKFKVKIVLAIFMRQ